MVEKNSLFSIGIITDTHIRAPGGDLSTVFPVNEKANNRARYAVEQRFGLQDGRKRSYREVGEELGVTAEAARRLVKRAVNIVRESAPDQADIDAA